MLGYGPEWALWAWIVVVVVSIAAAVAVRLSARPMLSSLTPHHVAAAAIVGLLAWAALLQLPNLVLSVLSTYAGIDGAPAQGLHQAYAVSHIVVVGAAAFAVLGLVRRRAWAVPLALGVCLTSIGSSLISLAGLLSVIGDMAGSPGTEWFVVQLALQPVPAIVGLVLLAWPFVRGPLQRVPAGAHSRAAPADDGIVDAESDEAVDVEWPDWSRPAEDRR